MSRTWTGVGLRALAFLACYLATALLLQGEYVFRMAVLWLPTGVAVAGLWLLGAYMNLGLALFNLMPVPPLDGSRVLLGLLPLRWAREYVKMERFGFVIVLALVALGWMGRILVPAINAVAVLLGLPAIQEAG